MQFARSKEEGKKDLEHNYCLEMPFDYLICAQADMYVGQGREGGREAGNLRRAPANNYNRLPLTIFQ